MTDPHTPTSNDSDRIDDGPTPDPSPSAGWRGTAESMHVSPGRRECETPECDCNGHPVRILDGDDVRRETVRCDEHEPDVLEVSS